VATADGAVPTGPMNIHLEWLTSVLSNYWVPGSILGKETEYCETFVMVFSQFRVYF